MNKLDYLPSTQGRSMAAVHKKLRFDLVSDTHIEKWAALPVWAASENEIIIVAGDVSSSTHKVKTELECLAALYKTVLYIDGNHEYFESIDDDHCVDLSLTEDRLRLLIAEIPNAHYLKD